MATSYTTESQGCHLETTQCSLDPANRELRRLSEIHEPDEFRLLAGSYARVQQTILANSAAYIAEFLEVHQINVEIDNHDFREWFPRTLNAQLATLGELSREHLCGLALYLCERFRRSTHQSVDGELACSWALGIARDARIPHGQRMHKIAATVRESLTGQRSEWLENALRIIPVSKTALLLAVHLDAMRQAHSGSFEFACSMTGCLAEKLLRGVKVYKTQVHRTLAEFEKRGLIEYHDRGSNDKNAKRSARISLMLVQSSWPIPDKLNDLFLELSSTLSVPLLPRKYYTRGDLSCQSTTHDASAIKEALRGKWIEILKNGGLTAEQVSKRKSTCPFCGAEKQWRLGDRDGNGSGICDKCSPTGLGDGFKVLIKLNEWTFVEALNFATRFANGESVEIERTKSQTTHKPRVQPISQDLPDSVSYQKVLTEWCRLKSVDAKILAEFGAMAAYRRIRDENGSSIRAVVIRVPLYVAGEDGKPVRSGHCDFGTATNRLRKGMHGKRCDGVFLRDGIGFQADQLVYAVEGVKDAAALVGLGKWAVCGLPGLRVPKAARQLFAGCRIVLIPDREAIEKHTESGNQSPLAKCMASLWQSVTAKTARQGKRRPSVVCCDLQHASYDDTADDLRDVLKFCRSTMQRQVLRRRLEQHEALARYGQSVSGNFIAVDKSIRASVARFKIRTERSNQRL